MASPLKQPPYATLIPSRNPTFKKHSSIGYAKISLLSRMVPKAPHDMVIYELSKETGEYLPVLHVKKGDKREDYPNWLSRPQDVRRKQKIRQLESMRHNALAYLEIARQTSLAADKLQAELFKGMTEEEILAEKKEVKDITWRFTTWKDTLRAQLEADE